MIKSLNPVQTETMKEKVVAYEIFHGKKPWSFNRRFEHNYLEKNFPPLTMAKLEKALQDLEGSKNILFAEGCMKLNSKGAVDKRILVLTETHLHKFKPRTLSLRGSIPVDQIASVSLNTKEEWTVVIAAKRPHKDMVVNLYSNEQETASEFVTVLYRLILRTKNIQIPVTFNDSIQYEHYKTAVLTFQPSPNGKLAVKHIKADAHVLYYPLANIFVAN